MMTAGFVLAFIVLPAVAGISAFRHHMRSVVAQYRRELDRPRRVNVTSHSQRGGLTAGEVVVPRRKVRMVERPRFGQPTRLEPFYGPLWGDSKAQVLDELQAENVRSAGLPELPPMCCIDAAPADGPYPEPCDRCWKPGGYLPGRKHPDGTDVLSDEQTAACVSMGLIPTNGRPPWPDRHPALYRHIPWHIRRHIISHYTKEHG